jgi:Acetyltransferases
VAFCNYYIEREPQNCFVAVNDEDEAVGYILCAQNANAWYDVFSKEYIQPIVEENANRFLEMSCQSCLAAANEYPAHLHTDILPDYQRMGLGARMMETLIKHLREKGIPGLMLSVASDNAGAQAFYEKMGFCTITQAPNEIVMGIRL